MKKPLLYSALAFALVSCGSKNKSNNDANDVVLGNTVFVPLEESAISLADKKLTGDGALVGKNPLGSTSSSKNFSLQASLQEEGKLSFYAYSTKQLTDGIAIEFAHVSDALKVTIINGENSKDISDLFKGQSHAELNYSIDVHNQESPAHVTIASGSEKIFDSNRHAKDMKLRGGDSYFGVKLSSANLSKLDVNKAQPHDHGGDDDHDHGGDDDHDHGGDDDHDHGGDDDHDHGGDDDHDHGGDDDHDHGGDDDHDHDHDHK